MKREFSKYKNSPLHKCPYKCQNKYKTRNLSEKLNKNKKVKIKIKNIRKHKNIKDRNF